MAVSWRTRGLAVKLLIPLLGIVLLIVSIEWTLAGRRHRKDLENVVFRSAERLADVVRRSGRSSMLRNNREQIREIMDTIAAEPGIVRLRIFDQEGRISYSTDGKEKGHVVFSSPKGCGRCHPDESPTAMPQVRRCSRTFREEDGSRTAGIIQPILNEPSCYEAECHAHPPDLKTLGFVDVNVSLEEVDRFAAEIRSHRIIGLILVLLSVSGVVVLFIIWMVDRPIQRLLEGTERVAEGNFDHTIPITTRDELGMLAAAFNDMARRVQTSIQVMQNWNEVLQKRVEEQTGELKRTQEHLYRMDRMATLGKLSAMIAHEINNPLTGIRTSAKLLQRRSQKGTGSCGEEDLQHLSLIERESARCGEIVKDLMDFSRKAALRLEMEDAGHLTTEALRLVQHRLDEQGIQPKTAFSEDLPKVSCSGQQIVQALLAILINASEAMPDGGIVELRTGADSILDEVWISIMDDGAGMDGETLKHAFDPFFSTKEEVHGVGLGLAVAHGIVRRHGGRIEVTSEPAKGSVFTVHLPLTPPDTPKEESGFSNVESKT